MRITDDDMSAMMAAHKIKLLENLRCEVERQYSEVINDIDEKIDEFKIQIIDALKLD